MTALVLPGEYRLCVWGDYSAGGTYAAEAIVYTAHGAVVARLRKSEGSTRRLFTPAEIREVVLARALSWIGARV